MITKFICAHVTAMTILVALIGQPAMAAERGNAKTGIGPIRRSIQAQNWTIDVQRSRASGQRPPMHLAKAPRPPSRKFICGVIGFVAGTVVGGLVGRGLYPDDIDGGGVIIGASVGAVAGPVLGVWVGSR